MIQKRIHIFVTGRVQGVFFRQSTRVMAIKNNVNGWIRNLDDGRVEIVAEGEKQILTISKIGVKLDLQILVLMSLNCLKKIILVSLKTLKLDISELL